MSALTPRKCGYRHDPPRLVLCYEKDGKARQRTMPVRSSSKRSIAELVDELMKRHARYLAAIPRQQLCKLVERLVQGPLDARTVDARTGRGDTGHASGNAPTTQRNAGDDDSSESSVDDGMAKAAARSSNAAAPVTHPTAQGSLSRLRTVTHTPSSITGLSSSSEASLSDMLPQPAAHAPSVTGLRSDSGSSSPSDGIAVYKPTPENPGAQQTQPRAGTQATSATGLSSSSLSDIHAGTSDDESSLLHTTTSASQPKKTLPTVEDDISDDSLDSLGQLFPRSDPPAGAENKEPKPRLATPDVGLDDDYEDLSEDFMAAADNADVASPTRKPMVKFKSRDEIFEFSRDSSHDTLSQLANEMTSSSPRPDADDIAAASPVRQELHGDRTTPLTSTPRKDAGSVLGAMPPLLGLSPLSGMPPLAGEGKKKATATKKKTGKAKGGKAAKKKGKGKKSDLLLGLLDDDDEDDDLLAHGVATAGVSLPDSEESGKETTAASPKRNATADAGKQEPTTAAQGDRGKAGAEVSVPFLQRLKDKQRRGDGRAPVLNSSSDSEVDSTGRFKTSPAPAKSAATAVDDTPNPVRPEDLKDSFSSLEDDSLSFAAAQGAAVAASRNSAVPFRQPSPELSLLSLQHDQAGGDAEDSGEDLNVVDEDVLVAKKKQMDKGFEANRVKPTDADFQYDIEEDFGELGSNDDCGWDEDGDEDDEAW